MDEMENSSFSASTNLESETDSVDADGGDFKSVEVNKDDKDSFTVLGRTIDDDIGEYYFESDHLSLKGNSDYCRLLRTVTLLEAQRIQAIQDLDKLLDIQHEALSDPITFVNKLQRKEVIGIPRPQKVTHLPNLDWDKYSKCASLNNFVGQPLSHRHMTRNKKVSAVADTWATSSDRIDCSKTESDDSSGMSALQRGKVSINPHKSGTFNQLWTSEEQKRLENYLVIYPPEEVEARRWEKIAKAFGNRTPQQVASRVQKYFIKLTRAGLPVPGRIPNMNTYIRKPPHRHQRHNRFLFHSSTFFASHEPPVFMSELDDDSTACSTTSSSASGMDSVHFAEDDSGIAMELRDSQEYRELVYLQQLKKARESHRQARVQHTGFKCFGCNCEPIIGIRWFCLDCSIDLCDNCSDRQFESKSHDSSHQMEQVTQSQSSDGDYTQFLQGDYNYLDPNYMPAS